MNPSSASGAGAVQLSTGMARAGLHGPVIIDTNVLIGGLPTANGPGTLAPILDGMLDGSIAFIVSDALLSEYRAVLLRPALLARLRLTPSEVAALVDRLACRGIAMQPVPAPPAPDPGDQLLWELLAACPDARLLTRDTLLLRKGRMRRRVILPEAFDLLRIGGDPSHAEAAPSGR